MIDLRKKYKHIDELNGIITKTATEGGHLRQFEMKTSKDYCLTNDEERMQVLQEHVEHCLGMIQRISVIVTDVLMEGGRK